MEEGMRVWVMTGRVSWIDEERAAVMVPSDRPNRDNGFFASHTKIIVPKEEIGDTPFGPAVAGTIVGRDIVKLRFGTPNTSTQDYILVAFRRPESREQQVLVPVRDLYFNLANTEGS